MFTARHAGFTIIELLIVIVVIGILAAITAVAYNGIQQRAYNTMMISTARSWDTLLQESYQINGTVAVDLNSNGGFNPGETICLGIPSEYPAAAKLAAGQCGVHDWVSDDLQAALAKVGDSPNIAPSGGYTFVSDANQAQAGQARGIRYEWSGDYKDWSHLGTTYSLLLYQLKGSNLPDKDCVLAGSAVAFYNDTSTTCYVNLTKQLGGEPVVCTNSDLGDC